MSNISVGLPKLYFYKLAYKPVLGDLKSGIPQATEIPAPATTYILSACLILSAASFNYIE